MIPECSRPVSLDSIGSNGLTITMEATPAECSALATRMRLPAIHSLSCTFDLRREGRDTVSASAHLQALVRQTCVVTLEDFDAAVEERFQIRFVPEGAAADEIDPEAEDEVPFLGDALDLGEAAAEQLGLALDPYPRMPGAELPEMLEEPDDSPFAALRRLN